MNEQREMKLAEYVEALPTSHAARREFAEQSRRIAELEAANSQARYLTRCEANRTHSPELHRICGILNDAILDGGTAALDAMLERAVWTGNKYRQNDLSSAEVMDIVQRVKEGA